jgi:hypothetical protein
MAATVAGILLHGTHAARPAASAPPVGSVYSCSDHGLVYVTDGASWTTWATLGSTVTFGGTGDMPASNPGDAEAAGASGKVSDAGHVHGRESFGSAGDIGASAPTDAAAAGATGKVADAGHKHPRASERVVYEFIIDGGGSAIATGVKGDLYVPDAFTLQGWALAADQSGSIVVDVWNDTRANFPPTVADSLNAGGGTKPTLSSAQVNRDTTLTSYDTSIPADSFLRFNVDSATTVTRVVLALWGVRV